MPLRDSTVDAITEFAKELGFNWNLRDGYVIDGVLNCYVDVWNINAFMAFKFNGDLLIIDLQTYPRDIPERKSCHFLDLADPTSISQLEQILRACTPSSP